MDLCAVVVLYRPDLETTHQLLHALVSQNVFCIIVDNSLHSHQAYIRIHPDHFYFISNGENQGIAKAQNTGLCKASDMGFEKTFIFDQDSQITPDFAEKMCADWKQAKSIRAKIAGMGPQVYCQYSKRIDQPLVQRAISTISTNVVEVTQIIASGMLIDLTLLGSIGLKDESLFIDGVDHEWCWRARSKGYSVALTQNVVMRHSMGERRLNIWFIKIKIGSPIRLYYQTRNLFNLMRRNYVPVYWKARNLGYFPIKVLINVLCTKNRRQRLKFIAKGVWHACLGETGKIH
jgi:rhamnosyltransferase